MKLPEAMSTDKILVVDDHEEIANLISLYLRQKSYEVHTAFSGEAAIKLMEEHSLDPDNMFDLLITDQEMPGMLGSDLVNYIRDETDFPALKIMMVTSIPAEELKGVRFDAHMKKPLDLLLLVDMVLDLLSH
jgi:CheY-like chemotaxis protein